MVILLDCNIQILIWFANADLKHSEHISRINEMGPFWLSLVLCSHRTNDDWWLENIHQVSSRSSAPAIHTFISWQRTNRRVGRKWKRSSSSDHPRKAEYGIILDPSIHLDPDIRVGNEGLFLKARQKMQALCKDLNGKKELHVALLWSNAEQMGRWKKQLLSEQATS